GVRYRLDHHGSPVLAHKPSLPDGVTDLPPRQAEVVELAHVLDRLPQLQDIGIVQRRAPQPNSIHDHPLTKARAGTVPALFLRSQCYRLRLQEPDSDGSPRGLRPPELPAGKRGGWHHGSVYPRLASPPFPHGL